MGPLSPFSQAHALWARGHFKHRVKGVRWVIKGHELRNVWKGLRLDTHPFICHGRLRRKKDNKRKPKCQNSLHMVQSQFTRTHQSSGILSEPDCGTRQSRPQTLKFVCHMSGSLNSHLTPRVDSCTSCCNRLLWHEPPKTLYSSKLSTVYPMRCGNNDGKTA